jgi:dienelactone hydrolase
MAEWRARIRTTFFAAPPLPPLAPLSHGRFEPAPGVVAERITYATQFGMRIPAILYLPQRRSGKVPALIVVNGHGGDKYSWYSYYSGILYARAGAAVLTFDMAGEGERNLRRESGTRAHDMEWRGSLKPGQQPPPEQLARRLAGLMLTDVMQAVSYLGQRPEVDPTRIGAMGYSVGAFVLDIAGAVDPRLRVCVLAGGGNLDGPGEYWDHAKPLCSGVPYQSLQFLGDRAAVIYALHADRGPTLIYNGLEDDVVAIPTHSQAFFEDLRMRTARLRGSPRGLFETGFLERASHRPHFVTRPVALWLEEKLDLPNRTKAEIQSMPETHISAWARENGAELEPFYSSELREGGVRALGAGVPVLSRQRLSVFTEPEWNAQTESLVFENWVREAKLRMNER